MAVKLSPAIALAVATGCGGGSNSAEPDAALDLTPAIATPGERCAPGDRVALIEISDGRVRADLFDRPTPLVGEPALSDAACDFFRYQPAQPCDPCGDGELCGLDGTCVAAPRRDTGGRVILGAGGDEQAFEAEPELGFLGGDIALGGTRFSVAVDLYGQRITLEAETEVTGAIPGLAATLSGTYDAPEAIDATWPPLSDAASHLFTHIPINHHAGGATFTECAIDTASGTLHIDQPMLKPLAVSTGLEFQTFEHVRFAAAEVSRGCVELRFTHRDFVDLGF
jgi:hypothetical protein